MKLSVSLALGAFSSFLSHAFSVKSDAIKQATDAGRKWADHEIQLGEAKLIELAEQHGVPHEIAVALEPLVDEQIKHSEEALLSHVSSHH